jgi:hypothetical protein
MKLAIVWLLLLTAAVILIAAVSSYDAPSTDPSIVVIGDQAEIDRLALPLLDGASVVATLDDLPSSRPSIVFLTVDAASSLANDALAGIARKGVAIGGLNVPIEELARLNGTLEQRHLVDEAFVQAGEQPPEPLEPPLWSFLWISCGILADYDLTPGTRGAEGTFDGPLGRRPFEGAFKEMKALGDECASFDPTNLPHPSYRVVVVGPRQETSDFAIPFITEALYVDHAEDVPFEDVAIVLITPSGARESTQYEPEPLALLRYAGVPIVGLDVDLADLLQMTGVIAALRGVSDEVADDAFDDARWHGQHPMYSYMDRSCPLDGARQGGQGQMWIGGFGAAPESPPLRTFSSRIEGLRDLGARCIDILRAQQQAYIDSLYAED